MADVFTPEKRSEVMSRIRGGGTKPELVLRSSTHSGLFKEVPWHRILQIPDAGDGP